MAEEPWENNPSRRYESALHGTIRGSLFCYTAANGLMLVVRLAGGKPQFVVPHLLSAVGSLGLALLIRPDLSPAATRLVFHGIAALLTLSLASLALLAGGSHAPALFTMAVIPLLGGLGSGLRAALFWTLINWVIVLAFWRTTSSFGLLPAHERAITRMMFSLGLGAIGVFLRRSALRYIDDLHDRDRLLQHQAAELIRARDEALQASQAKSDFLATMSHELRTPLHAIIGSAELLRETSLSSEQRDHMAIISSGSQSLLTVIGDILDLSKLDANKVALMRVPFDLRECADDAVALVRTQAEARGLSLKTHFAPGLPPAVKGDPERLRQILLNLLSNAVKFTEQGAIELRVGHGEQPSWTRFEVQDTGPGITQDQMGKLFQSFSQVDSSRTRRHGGVGLGLAISKALVQRMGGSIGVDSDPGQGSTFFFELPLEALATREALRSNRSVPKIAAAGPPLRIVVAEDNPINQIVITRLLARLGYEVRLAEDGQKTLDLLAQASCDVLLLDVQMPVLDGLEVARILARRPRAERPYIIGLTANASTEDRATCLAAGMDDFLTKPVEMLTLRRTLDHAAAAIQQASRPAPRDEAPA
jgi:signal transduction histidine kinase/ActR/RegA family two-component response regulator